MPRNGDGSGDSGPYEGHEILHGTSGDTTLQHTKHVAPMPEQEDGEALPGMSAGGVAAPLNDTSEEFGATAPRNEQFVDDEASASKNGGSGSSTNTNKGTPSSNNKSSASTKQQDSGKTTSGGKSSSGGKASSGNDNQGSNKGQGKSDLEDISRKKAERYVNLNEEDVQHAGASDKSSNDAKRSSQRAPRDVGPKEDIELLHGNAGAGQGDDKKRSASNSGEQQGGEKSRKQDGSGSGSAGGNGKDGAEGHDHESDPMRHNAAKFVNMRSRVTAIRRDST